MNVKIYNKRVSSPTHTPNYKEKQMNAKRKALLEHYAYATTAAAVAIWQGGNHDVKKVAWAALVLSLIHISEPTRPY